MSSTTEQGAAPTRGRAPVAELLIGAFLVLLGAGVLLAAAELRGGNVTDPLGPRGFPTLLGLGFLCSGLAVAVQALRHSRHPVTSPVVADEDDDGPALKLRLLLASAAVVLYAVVLPVAGFLLTTIAFTAGMIRVQGGAAPKAYVAMVLGFPLAVYLLFQVVLGVPLPSGFFDPAMLLEGL